MTIRDVLLVIYFISIYYSAVLIVRFTDIARPFVISYGMLTQK